MSAYPMKRLSDAGVVVLDCEHKTPKAQPTGHPYIAIPDVVQGRVDLSRARRISDGDLASWNRRTTPRGGDVLVTRRGRVGDTATIPDGLRCAIGQNLVLLRSRTFEVSQEFLRWVVRGPQWWAEVDRLLNVGAVFSSLNVKDIGRIRIPVPGVLIQRRIAAMLGALDDKIAANHRIVTTSVELADALFLVASHESVNSDITFDDIASIRGGGTPSTKEESYWGGNLRWATPTDVTALRAPYLDSTARTITSDGLDACSSALHPPGSILMTSRATIGAFAIAKQPTAVNQGFIVVNAHDASLQWWLFHEMRSRVAEFLSHANGATFLELGRGGFRRLRVRLADPPVIREFSKRVDALHGSAHAATVEASRLSVTRDALLPLLMSGKLRVKDAERQIEEVT